MSSIQRSARLALAAAGFVLPVLVACGTSDTPAAPSQSGPAGEASASAAPAASPAHNDADIRFAQMMIPHHQQAVEMAEMATERAASSEVRELAEQIRAAQAPEIATLTGFLQAWGAEVPATGPMGGMDHGDMSGMDHSGTNQPGIGQPGMAGMMSPEQMDQLRGARGADFDTMFLQGMIAHHEGAVADAQRELTEGTNPEAKALAEQIVSTQTAEISRMEQLLQSS